MARDDWDPFQDLMQVQKRMNRLFEAALTGSLPETHAGPVGWKPVADVHETDDSLLICLELAGLRREEIEIEVDQGVLVVRGERHPHRREADAGRYHRLERAYGPFHREFRLPESVDREQISAQFRNGVLSVTLPKKPEDAARHRRVAVD
jgi:HSP20 family protein